MSVLSIIGLCYLGGMIGMFLFLTPAFGKGFVEGTEQPLWAGALTTAMFIVLWPIFAVIFTKYDV